MANELPQDVNPAAEEAAVHRCPKCGGSVPAWDIDTGPGEVLVGLCPTCRSTEGMFTELWVQWECLSKYGNQHGRKEDCLGRFSEWPAILELACRLFAHATFTQSTWERLEAWLLTYHAKDREAMHTMPRGEIVRLLRVAVEGGNADLTPPADPPEQDEENAGADSTPIGGTKESVDAKGEVTNPADPTAYVPAHEARLKYTPAGLVTTHKQFVAILADNPAIRRWHPQTNRLCVHLADWTAFVAKQTEQRDADGLLANPAEIVARTAEIRRKKSLGK